jgi:hypothetical protein
VSASFTATLLLKRKNIESIIMMHELDDLFPLHTIDSPLALSTTDSRMDGL